MQVGRPQFSRCSYLIIDLAPLFPTGAGLVESEWVDAGTGHPRKYYWLTETGKEGLRAMARFWTEFSADLDPLLDPL